MLKQPVPLEHHPDYWHDDSSIVFQVDQILYRIHLSILQKLSPVFRDIFTIPQITAGRAIQGSEENPIILEQTKKEEFDDFLLWIYRTNWTPPPHPEKIYINLLRFCQMWQIDEGTAFAIHHLEKAALPPTRRLELSRMFSVFDWIRPALNRLILDDFIFINLSDDELNQLGIKTYSIIVKARHTMERERRLIAAVPLPMKFDITWDCGVHDTLCTNAWKAFWVKKIWKKLLHPSKPFYFHEIGYFVSKNSHELGQMTERCREAIISQVLIEDFPEDAIIDGATVAITDYYRSL